MRKIKRLKFKKKNFIISLIIIIIMFISGILLYKHYQETKDIYKDKNLLLGTWIYNEYGGTYIFNEDNTYIQYSSRNTSNNYCKGKYKYTYGISQKKGITIRQDDTYYYYNLKLHVKECYIMNQITNENYTKEMFFGINKNENFNEILFANAETANIFTLTKAT